MKRKRCVCFAMCAMMFLSGCVMQTSEETGLTAEERERNAVRSWFENDISDEDEFTDLADYQYYARTIGLEKDGLLAPEMWEIYYSENININKEIDGSAIYLIRLDPDKLLEIWAGNNDMTAEEVCSALGVTRDELYYNFGYTSNSVDYAKNHKENKVTYPETEKKIFGADNGENRQNVFSTHFLKVDIDGKFSVTYESTDEALSQKQRDLLHSVTKPKNYDISEFDVGEITAAFYIDDLGIKRVTVLSFPSGRNEAEENSLSLMLNMSPFSYGCTAEDKVDIFNEDVPVEHQETNTSPTSDVPPEHLEETGTEGSGE